MELKTINIKGKEYVTVAERVRGFNELYPNGSISTELIQEGNYVRCKATVTPDVAFPARFFTGHSEEDRTQGNINKTNATENCETSAVGRALGMMGIGIVEGIASADEMVRFEQKQQTPTQAPKTQPSAPQSATHVCKTCSKPFTPKAGTESYAKDCYDCYKKAKAEPVQEAPVTRDEVNLENIPF